MSPEERQAMLARVDALAARLAPAAAAHDRASSFAHEHMAALHEAGYLRLPIPRAHGGAGADVFEMVQAQEHLARGDAASALVAGMLMSLLGRVMDHDAWPAPVLAAVCRELAEQGGGINSCVTEPELGSISRGGVPATTAIPSPGGWRIS
ncbi:MAG TPA: acyl-CoA dehydrogenase family protein, partial [Acetobacteraceae bacterium]